MSFKFKADLRGIATPGSRPGKGLYRVRYAESEVLKRNEKTGCTTVQVDWSIADGPNMGGNIRTFFRLPDSDHADPEKAAKANKDALRQWRLALRSAGIAEVDLDRELVISDETLQKGRVFALEYNPKDEAAGRKYDETNFLTPEQFAAKSGAAPAQEAQPAAVEAEVEAVVVQEKSTKTRKAKPVVEEDPIDELLGDV